MIIPINLKIILLSFSTLVFFILTIIALYKKKFKELILMLSTELASASFLLRALSDYSPHKYGRFFPKINFYSNIFFGLFILIAILYKLYSKRN